MNVVHDVIVAQYNHSSTLTIENTDLLNYAGLSAIKVNGGTLNIISGKISGGRVERLSKAVWFLESESNATFGENVEITNQKANVILSEANAHISFAGKISNNTFEASLDGAHAVGLLGGDITLESTGVISNNINSFAGVFYVRNASAVIKGEISNNETIKDNAGALYIYESNATIEEGAKILNNTAATADAEGKAAGAGLFISYSSNVTMNGGTITGNTAANALSGNDVGITNYSSTAASFGSQSGSHVLVGKNMVIGDGIANGYNQYYQSVDNDSITLGHVNTDHRTVLTSHAAANSMDIISNTAIWASVQPNATKIDFGVKVPVYNSTAKDLYALATEIDATTGNAIGECFSAEVTSTDNGVAQVDLPITAQNTVREFSVKLVLKDHVNEAPVINASDVTINVGDTFDPLDGVTATDAEDGNIVLTAANVTANNVDTTTAGLYSVTYSVSDSEGLNTQLTIKVTVVEKTIVTPDPDVTPTPDTTVTPDVVVTPTTPTTNKVVKTSDDTNATAFIMLSLSSAIGVILLRKKKFS